ncbi:MAG: mfpsA [Gemmatimonadetes bacterium]|nr:mfpsA [Gemmatimonadota bacterium]
MIRILRLRGGTELLTAQSFEQLFERHLGGEFAVRPALLAPWLERVLGPAAAPLPLAEAAERFREAAADVEFFCPDWEAIPLAALLLALRNLSGSPARMLFIAHAAGAYAAEWAMMRPLLGPGDVVVTPSESARRTVELMVPALAPWLHVIHHPMQPLARVAAPATQPDGRPARPRIVSLGRVSPRKLVHRQVEAMEVLRRRGRVLPRMEIAGALDDDPAWDGPHPYGRGLAAKIRRLGLGEHVRLVGPIRGDEAKAAFLSGAALLVNLSVTLEESFPKTPVEALGVGVPVLGTSWNGLRDTVGDCGVLLPLSLVGGGVGLLDVSAESVADGIERLLDDPPSPEACMAWVERFRPEVSLPRYRAALAGALDALAAAGHAPRPLPGPEEGAAPAAGLLSRAAPLTHYGWTELFGVYAEGMAARRVGARVAPGAWERLGAILTCAVQPMLERFFAGLPDPAVTGAEAPAAPAPSWSGSEFDRLLAAGSHPGLTGGRVACLAEMVGFGRVDLLSEGLDRLEAEGRGGTPVDFMRVEALNRSGRHEDAFALCTARLAFSPATEYEAHRVRQAAAVARRWGRPALALPWLAEWLERFPDAQESGPTWLDLAVTAARVEGGPADGAEAALERARALLGDIPAVRKTAQMLGRRAAAALA